MRWLFAIFIFSAGISGASLERAHAAWTDQLAKDLRRIDAISEGELGVYVKRLRDGTKLDYQATRKWYLASTVKVPLAVVLLQKSEQKTLSLDRTVLLRRSDFVDGSGDLLVQEPGTAYTLRTLLEKMLTMSDSTAADIILRAIGESEFNRQLQRQVVRDGFNPITSLLQVRYDAYGELHPEVRRLSNIDFIELKRFRDLESRLNALLDKLKLKKKDLRLATLEEAFERYYARGFNSASLSAFGDFLERLSRHQLLSPATTDLLLDLMEKMVTGEKRLKAGLPIGTQFAQKTGTQLGRLCNVGIVRQSNEIDNIVVAVCLEKFKDQVRAEKTLRDVGRSIARSGVIETHSQAETNR